MTHSILSGAPQIETSGKPALRGTPVLLMYALRSVALLLAFAGAAAGALSESMNSDGISYLDIGDAWFRGEWRTAINATWSPLYAVILGAVMRVVRPGLEWEFAVAHAVNFLLFLAAMLCFELFLREASRKYFAAGDADEPEPARLPPWAFSTIAYGLFIWGTTALIPVFGVTPDMIVAACVFAAAAALLRVADRDTGWLTFAGLGVALGVGYLAKAAMFPMALVFVSCVLVQLHRAGLPKSRVIPAVLAFLLVGGPFILVLSVRAGEPSFSDVGPFAILKHVHEVPVPPYDPSAVTVPGVLENPLERIGTTPPVYGYGDEVGGTYPIAYEPAHWLRGLEAPFDAAMQLRTLASTGQYYFSLFARLQGVLMGILAVLLAVAFSGTRSNAGFRRAWPLVVTAAAAFGMYSLVYVTGRYIGGFIVIFMIGLLMMVRLREHAANRRLLGAAGGVMALAVGMNIVTYHLDGLNAMLGLVPSGPGLVSATPPPAARPSVVARHLIDLGVEPGDRVGVLGYAFDSFWARLARVRIVGEVAPADLASFWDAGEVEQEQVVAAFSSLGARVLVAEQVPDNVRLDGWTRLGTTSYYARFVEEQK